MITDNFPDSSSAQDQCHTTGALRFLDQYPLLKIREGSWGRAAMDPALGATISKA